MESLKDTSTSGTGEDSSIKDTASLSETSKSGFNPKAWNDPPSGLLGVKPKDATSARPKLTARVAFPMDASKQPSASGTLTASAPPPTQGFQPPVLGGIPPPPMATSTFNPTSAPPPS